MKAIIFDFFGTIMENGIFPSPVRQVKYFLRLREMPFQEYIVKFEKAFMTKKFENLEEAFKNVVREFNLKVPDFVIEKLIGLWNKNRLLAKPFPEVKEVLEDLKKDYKLILLSNSDCFSIEPLLEKYDMDKYFDAKFFSYETGLLKSNKEIFDKIRKKLGIKKEEMIIVGDSLESDIKSAENANIKAILVDRKQRMEYKNKISSLKELRNKIKEIGEE